jgi:hypothetical protein
MVLRAASETGENGMTAILVLHGPNARFKGAAEADAALIPAAAVAPAPAVAPATTPTLTPATRREDAAAGAAGAAGGAGTVGGATKTIGRRPDPAAPPRTDKTIGRRAEAEAPAPGPLTRALVRAQIRARLSGTLAPAALATWARDAWAHLNGGAACEKGQRELLDEVLLALGSPSGLTEDAAVAALASLDA